MLRCLDNDLMVAESVHRPIERRSLMTCRGSLAAQGRKLVSHDPNTPLSIPFKSPHFRWCLAFVTSAENTRTAGVVCCGRKGCKLMWALRSLGCDNHPFTCCWVLPDLGHNLVYRAACPDGQPFCRSDLKLSFRLGKKPDFAPCDHDPRIVRWKVSLQRASPSPKSSLNSPGVVSLCLTCSLNWHKCRPLRACPPALVNSN